jgi:hypothetical protein
VDRATLIAAADSSLYYGKRTGEDRVVRADRLPADVGDLRGTLEELATALRDGDDVHAVEHLVERASQLGVAAHDRQDSLRDALLAVSRSFDTKAASQPGHSDRVGRLCAAIAAGLGLPDPEQHDLELAGRRVAVIGTGCSAIQVVPAIQPVVDRVDVYQRSPGWTFPKLDFAYKERTKRLFERFPALQRADRAAVFAFMELGAAAMTNRPWLLHAFRAVGRWQINHVIKDPELRAKVTPKDEIGCKRIMLTDEWYPTLVEPNVDLIADRIETITPAGIRTADGAERRYDVLVLATGFKSHGFVAPMEVLGEQSRSLNEEWARVPRAYLGMSVPGFPNMFLLYGPNTNGGTGSVIYTIEAGVSHIVSALDELDRADARRIEVSRRAAEEFDRELRAALATTVWHSGCTNWYVDEDGNDPSQWPWLWSRYRRRTERIEPGAYELAA